MRASCCTIAGRRYHTSKKAQKRKRAGKGADSSSHQEPTPVTTALVLSTILMLQIFILFPSFLSTYTVASILLCNHKTVSLFFPSTQEALFFFKDE